ncbi:DoxX family protein [Paludisphaera rhizosphaerae]|uniref:DoxX family protein n=1 Tax=Paludisphaera rhizosphaerae TaxID=2711216 RepID=UPI0013EA44E0|nr:DoxX family protein [Paludisphaera rhizosphaerae]
MTIDAEIPTTSTPRTRTTAAWTGMVLSTLAILFLVMDGVMKVVKAGPVLEASAPLEIPVWTIPIIGGILLVQTLLYAIPQTAVLGAVLLTGYLGGATWTHLRMNGSPFELAFPSILATFVWGGLLLREPRLRALFPWRRPSR